MTSSTTANLSSVSLELHVSPKGNDRQTGTRSKPLKTLATALVKMRKLRADLAASTKTDTPPRPASLRIVLHDGIYPLDSPIQLTHDDSGVQPVRKKQIILQPPVPLTIAAAPNAKPILTGGRTITGFKVIKHHGQTAWVTTLPQVKNGKWSFSQLWVNGQRAAMPRLPEKGLFKIEEAIPDGMEDPTRGALSGNGKFRYKPGDLYQFQNLEDVEFVALHYWIESRRGIASINTDTRQVDLAIRARLNLKDDTGGCYYIENVFENLKKPGQWYLHKKSGTLYYLPKPGQTFRNTTIVAPVLSSLLHIDGQYPTAANSDINAQPSQPAQHIRFENITFSHNEYHPTAADITATPQAACHVPGAVKLNYASDCHFHQCEFIHIGSYGLEFRHASIDCSVTHSHFHDLAAGGVKIFQDIIKPPPDPANPARDRVSFPDKQWRSCQRIEVSDCHIHDGGHRFRQAVGVLAGVCNGVKIIHNHIHDMDYTGISVGWQWGYQRSDTFGNIIEWNHIHDIGRGVLSDMGGIYTLGNQCGTRIRYNLIHDIVSRGYGGWGIYPDEGSEDLLIEFNITARTKHAGISQHYGRNNVIRNNIILYPGSMAAVGLSVHEPHNEFFFEQNIVVTDHQTILNESYLKLPSGRTPAAFLKNLYFNTQGQPIKFRGQSFTQWKKSGQDKGSLVADPKFKNAKKFNVTLAKDSPAHKIGFTPFDLKNAGMRKLL